MQTRILQKNAISGQVPVLARWRHKNPLAKGARAVIFATTKQTDASCMPEWPCAARWTEK
jgi:hypothetical protein